MKPIKPAEVENLKHESIPSEIIVAFNELIVQNFNGHSSEFKQNTVIEVVLLKLRQNGKTYSSKDLYDRHWLDVEKIFEDAGWEVVYDKPGYNEDYPATFSFKSR